MQTLEKTTGPNPTRDLTFARLASSIKPSKSASFGKVEWRSDSTSSSTVDSETSSWFNGYSLSEEMRLNPWQSVLPTAADPLGSQALDHPNHTFLWALNVRTSQRQVPSSLPESIQRTCRLHLSLFWIAWSLRQCFSSLQVFQDKYKKLKQLKSIQQNVLNKYSNLELKCEGYSLSIKKVSFFLTKRLVFRYFPLCIIRVGFLRFECELQMPLLFLMRHGTGKR